MMWVVVAESRCDATPHVQREPVIAHAVAVSVRSAEAGVGRSGSACAAGLDVKAGEVRDPA
jgi:hypothetical protein